MGWGPPQNYFSAQYLSAAIQRMTPNCFLTGSRIRAPITRSKPHKPQGGCISYLPDCHFLNKDIFLFLLEWGRCSLEGVTDCVTLGTDWEPLELSLGTDCGSHLHPSLTLGRSFIPRLAFPPSGMGVMTLSTGVVGLSEANREAGSLQGQDPSSQKRLQ